MNITHYSFTHAGTWFRQAIASFRQKPMPLLLYAITHLIFTNMMVALLIVTPAFISIPLFCLSIPISTFIAFNAARITKFNQQVSAFSIFEPLSRGKRILSIAKLFFLPLTLILVFILMMQVFFVEELKQAAQLLNNTYTPESMQQAMELIWVPVLLFAVSYYIIMLIVYFASVLIGQSQIPLRKSVFFATLAILSNKGALIGVALYMIGLFVGVQLIIAGLAMLGIPNEILNILSMPMSLIALSIMYSSLYEAFNDIFYQLTPKD